MNLEWFQNPKNRTGFLGGCLGLIVIGVLGVLLLGALIAVFNYIGVRNDLALKSQPVKQAWSEVENQYQRRADLIPNLVEVVKAAGIRETELVKALADVSKVTMSNPGQASAAEFAQYQTAQNTLGLAIRNVIVIAQQKPDFKSHEDFQTLMSQLEGTENRIAVARRRYNEKVREFNDYLVVWPRSTVGAWAGFKELPYFKSEAGSEVAPKIKM